MIFIIDILGAARCPNDPEILTRIIEHEPSAADARERAMRILAGVDYVGAWGVRLLDHDGTEIYSNYLKDRDTTNDGQTP